MGTHIESLTDLFADLSDLTLDILTSRIIRRTAKTSPANRSAHCPSRLCRMTDHKAVS